MGYIFESHLKPICHEVSFADKLFFNDHSYDTAVHYENIQNDWTIETDVAGEGVFTKIEFKMSFSRISCIAQSPYSKCHWIQAHLITKIVVYNPTTTIIYSDDEPCTWIIKLWFRKPVFPCKFRALNVYVSPSTLNERHLQPYHKSELCTCV